MVAGVVKHLFVMVLNNVVLCFYYYMYYMHTALDCGPPLDLDNGYVNYVSTTFLSQASYTCEEGYNLSLFISTSTSTCEADGEWSGRKLLCISKNYII